MSTTIKYQNNFGAEISNQQAAQLLDYKELIFENTELKRINEYADGSVLSTSIFIDINESYQDYVPESGDKIIDFYFERTVINGYIAWKKKYYINGALQLEYIKVIFDTLGREIASQQFDSNDNPISSVVKTYYFGGKPIILDNYLQGYFPEDASCIFYHKLDGSVEIYLDPGNGVEEPYYSIAYFLEIEANGAVLPLMNNDEVTYYTSPTPLIPNF